MTNIKTKTQNVDGFSVLEAMVAVAILSIAFLSLLQLQGQFVKSIASFERADTRITIRTEVAQHVQSINFTQQKTGEIPFGGAIINWQAVPIGGAKKVRGDQRFYMAIYSVSITVVDPTLNRPVDSFSVTGLGWAPDRAFRGTIF